MKHLIIALFMLSVVDFSVIHDSANKIKSYIIITYSDQSEDKVSVDTDKLTTQNTYDKVKATYLSKIND